MKNYEDETYSERINRLNRIHSIGTLARYRRAKAAFALFCFLLPAFIIALAYAVYVLLSK